MILAGWTTGLHAALSRSFYTKVSDQSSDMVLASSTEVYADPTPRLIRFPVHCGVLIRTCVDPGLSFEVPVEGFKQDQ
jgi:hypothetical protein